MKMFKIVTIKTLQDNYAYLLIDTVTKITAAIDPVVDVQRMETILMTEKVTLDFIFNTHHHWDHSSGNQALKDHYPNVKVIGGDERIEGLDTLLPNENEFMLGSLTIKPIHTPGHTRGHICYHVQSPSSSGVVFTGDTLFIGGCGRFFEGTPQDMYTSLIEKLSKLPNDTYIYCGHEYTKFASTIEPENQDIKDYLRSIENEDISFPTTIGLEKLINPFMRVKQLASKLGAKDPVDSMRILRELKNKFNLFKLKLTSSLSSTTTH